MIYTRTRERSFCSAWNRNHIIIVKPRSDCFTICLWVIEYTPMSYIYIFVCRTLVWPFRYLRSCQYGKNRPVPYAAETSGSIWAVGIGTRRNIFIPKNVFENVPKLFQTDRRAFPRSPWIYYISYYNLFVLNVFGSTRWHRTFHKTGCPV